MVRPSAKPLARPTALPEHLASIWAELSGEVRSAIGAIGLESLCSQVHRMRSAREQIDREGNIVLDPRGNPAPHPALAVEKQASAEVREWLKRYGRH